VKIAERHGDDKQAEENSAGPTSTAASTIASARD